MYLCCVLLCKNRKIQRDRVVRKLSWHSFPKESERRNRWIIATGRFVRKNFRITKHTKVCGEHFIPTDFKPLLHSKQKYLKPDAIPSVFSFHHQETRKGKGKQSPKKGRKIKLKKTQRSTTVCNTISQKDPSPVNKKSSLSSKNLSRSSTSVSVATRPTPANPSKACSTKTAEAVPKDSLAGKLVISNQSSTMPDPNTLLRLLKLPPNIMFKINATNRQVVKGVVSKPATTNQLQHPPASTSVSKLTISLSKDPPVKPQSEVIIPEHTRTPENCIAWIKTEPEDMENIAQEVLEPAVEMYFEPEQEAVKSIKTEPIDDVESSQEEAGASEFIGPTELSLEDRLNSEGQFTKAIKIEPLDGYSSSGISSRTDHSLQEQNLCEKYKVMRQKHDEKQQATKRKIVKERKLQVSKLKKQLNTETRNLLNNSLDNLSRRRLNIVDHMVRVAHCKDSNLMEYDQEWILDCLQLRIQSPSNYEFLRTNNYLPLPDTATLKQHVHNLRPDSGINAQLLSQIREKLLVIPQQERLEL